MGAGAQQRDRHVDGCRVVAQRLDRRAGRDPAIQRQAERLRKKGASIALEPANAAYETRIFGPDRVKIQGRLAGIYRRYN